MLHNLTDFEIGWISGIIDGEGWIGMYKYKDWYPTTVCVGSTDKHTIDTLFDLTGLGSVHLNKRKLPKHDMWVWTVRARVEIVQLLSAVIDHLVTKKLQASILLGFCVSNIGGDYGEPFVRRLQKLNSGKFKSSPLIEAEVEVVTVNKEEVKL